MPSRLTSMSSKCGTKFRSPRASSRGTAASASRSSDLNKATYVSAARRLYSLLSSAVALATHAASVTHKTHRTFAVRFIAHLRGCVSSCRLLHNQRRDAERSIDDALMDLDDIA